jgi:cytochrome c peroxidase
VRASGYAGGRTALRLSAHLAVLTVAAVVTGSCGSPGPNTADARAARLAEPGDFPSTLPATLPLHRGIPPGNRLTPARIELGRRLFHDPIVSADSSLACASCHRPELGFSDTVAVSPGVGGRLGRRTTPTLLNRTYGRTFFWDGRAETLEDAVLRPIQDPVELALPLDELTRRLEAHPEYRRAFGRAFHGEPVSPENIGRALASFVRTLVSGDSPADRFAAGDSTALSNEQRAGRRLFFAKARCTLCHGGPNLTDEQFHNTGVAAASGDPGRYGVSGRDEDLGRFKTPTLREIGRRPPFMHDGSLRSLQDVVEFYDRGGGDHPLRSADIHPLGLTAAEQSALAAFLQSL